MRPITEFLIEFPRALPPALHDHGDVEVADVEDRLADAVSEARRAGMEEAQALAEAEWTERLAALREDHAADLAAARARWAETEGAGLSEALGAGLVRIEHAIAASLAAALMPVLEGALRTRAAEGLMEAVRRLLAGGQGALIEVRGPADLLEPVRLAYEDNPAVTIIDSDASEASVSTGDALVASQVEAWRDGLHAALESAR